MKNILNFILWQWNKWQTWQKVYIACGFLLGIGMNLPAPYKQYVMAVPISVVLSLFGKWWIWDPLKESWKKYNEEKKALFATIKESDK